MDGTQGRANHFHYQARNQRNTEAKQGGRGRAESLDLRWEMLRQVLKGGFTGPAAPREVGTITGAGQHPAGDSS